jgi:large subunit ribosomal protein L25
VIYGNKEEPLMVSVDPKTLLMELTKTGFFTKLVDIRINGETHRVLPRDVQFHPVSDAPIHVDFLRVLAGTEITVAVPVIFINEEESPGIKRGGVLNVVRHEIEFVCMAESIPQTITIDLTGLDIGDSVHIAEVALPEGVKPAVADRDFTIATVAAPTVRAEEDAAAQAALAGEGEEEFEEGAEAVVEGEAPEEEGKEEAAADEEKKEEKS